MKKSPWITLVCCLALSACGQGGLLGPTSTLTPRNTLTPTLTRTPRPSSTPTRTVTPTLIPPPLQGRIIAKAGDTVIEVSASADPGQVTRSVIASGVLEAALSPDFSRLVYSTFTAETSGRSTHLYDLESRTDEQILPYNGEQILWSPDGQRFSYTTYGQPNVTHGLYLFDVRSRTARMIYEPPCAAYGLLSSGRGVCGALREIAWVSSDELLIQRFKGEMPEKISSLQLEIPANTTTLLMVANGSQALVDSPRRWLIQDRCEGKVMLRDETDEAVIKFSIADAAAFASNPGSVNPIPLKSCIKDSEDCLSMYGSITTEPAYNPYIGFLPQGCGLFYFSGSHSDPLLHILSPETLEERSAPLPASLSFIAFRSDFQWDAGWPGRPDAQLAYVPDEEQESIGLVDLPTARMVRLLKGGPVDSFRLLAWIAP